MGLSGLLSRAFLYGASTTEVHGLDDFVKILDRRKGIEGRERGLITVSNHLSILDDPLIWGVLPIRYFFSPNNLRWSLGSYDICFTNKPRSLFFSLGQVLPTHRLAHSPHGGLFQPTITQCIRLLSRGPFPALTPTSHGSPSLKSPDLTSDDPFSSSQLTYSTNHIDTFPSPSSYSTRKHSWIHIFPEGKIHQHPSKFMRYFKWGVARLILESEPCPQVVPMWISGIDDVMSETRTFPRFVPRVGKKIGIVFGKEVDTEKVFGDLRKRWRDLRDQYHHQSSPRSTTQLSSSSYSSTAPDLDSSKNTVSEVEDQKRVEERKAGQDDEDQLGILPDSLKYHPEAIKLRIECTLLIRNEVLKLRKQAGEGKEGWWSDEDPKAGLAETWREEREGKGGRMGDGSIVKEG